MAFELSAQVQKREEEKVIDLSLGILKSPYSTYANHIFFAVF